MKKDIRKISLEELTDWFQSAGEKTFRAKQIHEWLWKKSATDFSAMTNLSKALREKMAEHFVINPIAEDLTQKSSDGTIKSRFKLHDNHFIEGVLIPTDSRVTACVSSQVGCSLSCKFCATGFMDRKRNLDAGEIYDQVVMINKQALENYNQPLTNIVFMGMGEPLLNYKNVMEAIHYITSEEGLNISSKRITVSTAGIAKMIKRLADDDVKFNLAISLHAPNDEKRNEIMPINEENNLEVLMDSIQYFKNMTGNKVTFEYILFDHFNDSIKEANELIALSRRADAMVNVIEYNAIKEADFTKSDVGRREKFIRHLEDHGVTAKVRISRGKDIDAACGQLANK